MARGEQLTKRAGVRGGARRFLERGFDWIALVLITIIILLTLVFF